MILCWEAIFMPLLDEVRNLIGDFYDGDMNAHQFREIFASMYVESDTLISEVQNVFIDIDSIYAGYITGRIDETQLRKQLFELLPSTRVHVPEINNLSFWNMPINPTQNNSSRLSSRHSARTNPHADIVLNR
jgi:hypothetical protein